MERGALEAGALRAGVDSGRRCMAALVNSRAAVCLLGQRRRKKNSGNGCCTKNCDWPWTGVGGRGRVWEGRWGLYEGPQRPPASRISSPTAARARVQPYRPFPARRVPSPTLKRRAGAGLPCPDSAGYNPACPSRVPKGRAQDGNRNAPSGLGLSHILAFPAQSVPLPTPKRRAGAGLLWLAFSIPSQHRVFGSNGNGPISSSMLRTARALAIALFLAGMLNA